mgnify:CR=1 FL=1|tara:strand:- start:58 stop:1584 length:1527 start_codon:yes stop_codon:yes gene_type:complete
MDIAHTELDKVLNTYEPLYHAKVIDFIQKELPERLEQQKKRAKRNEDMQNDADKYITTFLIDSDTKYMYISKSNIFVMYDGMDFKLVNESTLLHKILSNLSTNKTLLHWKYKIKNMIIKKIKETNIFDMIPESHTIQEVLNFLTPTLFYTKLEARYFLAILGDNIQKKQCDITHLVDIKCKGFLNRLNDHVFDYFQGKYHTNSTFKYAWHEHEYTNCRFIKFRNDVAHSTMWSQFIKQNILNIISVAVHYSNRYKNSDSLLKRSRTDKAVINRILYIQDKTPDILTDVFVKGITKKDDLSYIISFKEMLYLWKIFLGNMGIVNTIFSSNFKSLLSKRFTYCGERDGFIGVYSELLINTSNLCEFWKNYIVNDSTETMETSDICEIYNDWLTNEKSITDDLNEFGMLSILNHFHDLDIINNNIVGVRCLLWDKMGEFETVLDEQKINYKFSPNIENIGIEKVYNDYCKLCENKFEYRIISKCCFKKYIIQLIPNKYIIKKHISKEYWLL